MKFAKLQATGNDFILLDARSMEEDWQQLAQAICHRHLGIGADGLILVRSSNTASLRMRLFNSDGSEAEVSGNGLRCFAKYVIDRQIVPGPNLTVETLAGIRTIEASKSQGKVSRAKVNMGIPRFGADDIPVLIDKPQKGRGEVDIMSIIDYPLKVAGKKLTLSFVSMGNPHAVSFLSQPVTDFPLSQIGPEIENHPMFPAASQFRDSQSLKSKQNRGESLGTGRW